MLQVLCAKNESEKAVCLRHLDLCHSVTCIQHLFGTCIHNYEKHNIPHRDSDLTLKDRLVTPLLTPKFEVLGYTDMGFDSGFDSSNDRFVNNCIVQYMCSTPCIIT